MKKIKLAKEEDRDHKTLAKQYKRLEIFIIIFMVIAICLGTFYFNVICFGPECENKSPTPLIIINTGKSNADVEKNEEDNNNVEKTSNYSYEDIYAVYTAEENSNKECWLTLHEDAKFEYRYDGKEISGNYTLIGDKIHLNYVSERNNGEEKEITGTKEIDIINRTKLYDPENLLNLIRANIPTNSGE